MSTDLSPATEAILDAVCLSVFDAPAHACPNLVADLAPKLSQALRALAVRIEGADNIRQDILDIVAELETLYD